MGWYLGCVKMLYEGGFGGVFGGLWGGGGGVVGGRESGGEGFCWCYGVFGVCFFVYLEEV